MGSETRAHQAQGGFLGEGRGQPHTLTPQRAWAGCANGVLGAEQTGLGQQSSPGRPGPAIHRPGVTGEGPPGHSWGGGRAARPLGNRDLSGSLGERKAPRAGV